MTGSLYGIDTSLDYYRFCFGVSEVLCLQWIVDIILPEAWWNNVMYLLFETRFENPFTQGKNVGPKVAICAFPVFGKLLYSKFHFPFTKGISLKRILLVWFTFSQEYLLRIFYHILHIWHILRIYYRSYLIVVIANQWRFHTYLLIHKYTICKESCERIIKVWNVERYASILFHNSNIDWCKLNAEMFYTSCRASIAHIILELVFIG